VRQATVSTKTHMVKVRLKNGVKYAAKYPAGADPTASLRAHGAHVRVAAHKAKASSHIRTRYIVLGAAVLLLLAGGLCYLVWRRRSASGPAVDAGEPAG
jgi:hypothetical protein